MNFHYKPTPIDEIKKQMVNLTIGPCVFRIEEIVEGFTKANNPKWTVKMKVWDIDNKEAEIKTIICFQQNTDKILYTFYSSLGMEQSYAEANFVKESLLGKLGYAVIKHEEYEGEMYPKISYFINEEKYSKRIKKYKESSNVVPDVNEQESTKFFDDDVEF